jgi:GTPase SAR1 family protein
MSVKLLIISRCGTGKSSYVEKLKSITYSYDHQDMSGYISTVMGYKNKNFKIWITNSISEVDKYHIDANCVIYMLSDDENSIKYMHSDRKNIEKIYGDIPSIVLFNKSDIPKTMENYNLLKKYSNIENITVCSVKNDFHIFGPICMLLEILKKKRDLD